MVLKKNGISIFFVIETNKFRFKQINLNLNNASNRLQMGKNNARQKNK